MKSQHGAFALIWFAPFLVMLAIHELFGFSDAFMGIPTGEAPPPEWQRFYSLVMVGFFYLGPFAALMHYGRITRKRETSRRQGT